MMFNSIDQYISRAKNIWIVRCLEHSDKQRDRRIGEAYDVEVLKRLKGDSGQDLLTIQTVFNELVPEDRYLVFGFNQRSEPEAWLDNGNISPVPIPRSLNLNKLQGKSIKEQISIILSARLEQLDRLIKRYAEEKSVLEKGLEFQERLNKTRD
jgi:hypothetical protein